MTIKQYGSLTLDLNTVKQTYDSFGANLLIRLHDGNQITLQKEWHSQFTKDYQDFILQKKAQVIKEAFDYVWDGNWEVYKFQVPFNIRNKDIRVDIYPSGMSVSCTFVKVEPVNFNFNSTDKATWISYAQQIKDKYLDSIVDPVRIANQVLKFRGLDKEWQVSNTKPKHSMLALKLSGKEKIIFYIGCLNTLVAWSEWAGNKNYLDWQTPPTTNSEWVTAIEIALDKYYVSQQLTKLSEAKQQPTEVDLKFMLGKALKDNGLVAKEVTIPNHWCKAIVKVAPTGFIKWIQITGEDYIRCSFNDCSDIKYSLPKSLEDWQTIFSDSLAQYKKLTEPKLTRDDIIECLESALTGLPVESISGTLDDSIVGTVEVKLTKYKLLTWVIDKDSVIVRNHKGDCGFSVPFPYLPNTKEKWKQLFVTSLKQLLPVSKEPEPTLLDLLEKAFLKFTWIHEEDNYKYINTFIGTSFSHKIKVVSNIKTDVLQFDLSAKDVGRIHHFALGVITKQKLANSTGWQEWLDSVIESKANLDNLVSNPTVKDNLNKDVWSD